MPEASTPVVIVDPTKGIKVDAALIAAPFRDEIKAKVLQMKERGLGMFFCFFFTLIHDEMLRGARYLI